MKFPLQKGIATVRGDVLRKNECIQVSRKRVRESEIEAVSKTLENVNEKENVVINDAHPDQPASIGASLSPLSKE